ncbi:MAG: radical SAM protein [Desulfatiglandales bacterium]
MQGLDDKLRKAREISWENFGKRITFYLPGMFTYNGLSGKYPGISITGGQCALQCDHCKGSTLKSMIPAATPDALVEQCLRLSGKGNLGVLISGGCDEEGRLPWEDFIPAIKRIKKETNLYISIHSGLVGYPLALRLKEAGVDQALIDVIGDDETYQKIYHVPFGVSRIEASLRSLMEAKLPVVPHIICGLNLGKIKGERRAVEMISRFDVEQVVIVSLMRIPGTPLWRVDSPRAEEVAEIIAESRLKLPSAEINLGCARQRGDSHLETLAIDAGINRMALPSEEAIGRAMDHGLSIGYQRTCCSVSRDFSKEEW